MPRLLKVSQTNWKSFSAVKTNTGLFEVTFKETHFTLKPNVIGERCTKGPHRTANAVSTENFQMPHPMREGTVRRQCRVWFPIF